MAKKEFKSTEMTIDEAKEYRASLYKPQSKKLSDRDKREEFRIFWARSKKQYPTKTVGLEKILWLHLLATKNDDPAKFEKGLQHFGLKKISR